MTTLDLLSVALLLLVAVGCGLYAFWPHLQPVARRRARLLWLRGPGRHRYQAATMFTYVVEELNELAWDIERQRDRGIAGHRQMLGWLERLDRVRSDAYAAGRIQDGGPHLYPSAAALRAEIHSFLAES